MNEPMDIKNELERIRDKLERAIYARDIVKSKISDGEKTLAKVQEDLASAKSAQMILQTVAQTVQQFVHQRISQIVTRCLASVFSDPYEFRIDFVRKRGKTEAALVFFRDGRECRDPLNEVGGGVIDVASFALRLCCVMMTKPGKDRVLVLDEPFRNIRGKHNKEKIRSLLEKLVKDLGFQVILNVDDEAYPEFVLGDVIQLE